MRKGCKKENLKGFTSNHCHSRVFLSGISSAFIVQKGGDPRLQASGMTTNFKEEALNRNIFRAPLRSGFTLIELLVVVIIVAILAAIAVPQYQLAVEKTRVAQIVPILRAIQNANELYYLTHGQYTTDKSLLDVGFETPPGWNILVNNTSVFAYRRYRGEPYTIKLYYNHSGTMKGLLGKLYCTTEKEDEKAAYFCQSVGKHGTYHDVNSYRFFL